MINNPQLFDAAARARVDKAQTAAAARVAKRRAAARAAALQRERAEMAAEKANYDAEQTKLFAMFGLRRSASPDGDADALSQAPTEPELS